MPGGDRRRSRHAAVSLATAALLTGPLLAVAPPVRAEGTDGGSQLAGLAEPEPSELEALLVFLDRLVAQLAPPPEPAPVVATTVVATTVPPPPPEASPVVVVVSAPPPAPPSPTVPLLRPAPGGITRGFGYDGDHFHEGLDIDGETGDEIVAAADGIVVATSCGSGYGVCTVVDHGHRLTTVYAHLSEQLVTEGPVSRGEVIGLMGCTGSCTGSHLHFEVRVDDVAHDPLDFL